MTKVLVFKSNDKALNGKKYLVEKYDNSEVHVYVNADDKRFGKMFEKITTLDNANADGESWALINELGSMIRPYVEKQRFTISYVKHLN